MNKTIFEIKNLKCKYKHAAFPALAIDFLTIETEEVVFIVGPSGSGKSTLLETLGLMHETVVTDSNQQFKFQFNVNGISKDPLSELWHKREKEISDFRQKYFSFIFQETNLFSNLTVNENIILPALLQGIKRKNALKKAKLILNDIAPDLNGQHRVVNIAGGERQRVAFARAIVGNYSVLFADEPTGNLDMNNADKLMATFMKYLKTKNSTAVIVTHDINLAVKYADKIVSIKKEMLKNTNWEYGTINSKGIFILNEQGKWTNNGKELDNNEIKNILKNRL